MEDSMTARILGRDRNSVARVVFAYTLVSGLYILLSDRALAAMTADAALLTALQSAKGALFVSASAVLLLALLRSELLARVGVTRDSEERYRALFHGAHDAMFLLDGQERILDINDEASARYGYSRAELLDMTAADLTAPDLRGQAAARVEEAMASGARFRWRQRRRDGTELQLEIGARPVSVEGQACVLSSVRDVSRQVAAEARAARLGRLYQVLAGAGAAAAEAGDEPALQGKVCDVLVEAGYRLAWVGMVEPGGAVKPVAWAGHEAGYVAGLRITAEDTGRGRGPTGTAVREGRPVVARNIHDDPRFAPWRAAALARGYASSIALPLEEEGLVPGALNVYAAEPDALCHQWLQDPDLKEVPVVVYTASFPDPEDEALVREMGVVRYLVKPLEPELLLAEVRAVLEAAGRPGRETPPLEETLFLRRHGQRLGRKLQRKMAELERSERLWRAILDASVDGIVALDPAGNIAAWSAGAARIFGYAEEEVLGRPLALLVPEDEMPRAEEILDRARSDGRASDPQVWRRARDGRRVPVVLSVTDLGPDLGTAAVLRDLSDQRRSEHALRQAERRLGQILATSPAVTYTLRLEDGLIRPTWISDNLAKLFGWSTQAALEPGWWARNLHPDDRQQALATTKRLAAGEGVTHEYRFGRPDGEYRWVHDELHPIPGEDEVVGSWVDVTELREAEGERQSLQAQLVQAQKLEAIGTLAGGVAHDFNNNLAVILAYAGFVRDDLAKGDPMHEDIDAVLQAARGSVSLVSQLLAFSRQQVIEPEVLDLNERVRSLEKMLGRLMGEDVILRVDLLEGELAVEADPGQLDQVLMNLAVNARDAMPGGGTLHISTAARSLGPDRARRVGLPPGLYARLVMRDEGHGMSEETRIRIFEPFFSTKERGRGTGLGLATVYGIVKQAGGEIRVDSAPGQGTTFNILLPLVYVEERERRDAPRPARRRGQTTGIVGGETVLVVEDEPMVRKIVRRVLRQRGYHVLDAGNAGEALLICEQHEGPIHLLLSDVVMPRASGPQLAERLAPLRPDMAVMFMTGYTDDRSLRHGLGRDTPVLRKPFSPEELLAKVRRALDG